MRPDDPVRAFVGLGGNLGDVETTLVEALWALDALPQTTIQRQSAFYRTPAWGKTDQPGFVNAVVELRTRTTAPALLALLLAIEERFGRVRSEADRWGPRVLDLDLLAYGDEVIDEPGLTLPHPHLHERAFVLVPLAEIAPGLVIPGRGDVASLLAAVDVSGIEAIP
ncbi:MAG TPA: 2-amino-4-hydroxy-6-hydroxymethyldihydropteridine diphosphokinase [Arenimonas sp.]|uniref:2-amino-4-hydroxy-6- hydroxymethyldihydropteridine diphosphokinase n=1 Tax=Arenimonas sp. TaxID=1872635 RepID=UPI002D811618|nr:2-amino-4-hydroxy-6-hydroxymethyldihydropteridine diphosphokinase [Arenimonas sp.]HEU0152611.1 2-amino-4-hydroxy-6-hydroxymethyldihydropteridine diphosphokinase [Arenimonas sp.]